MQAKVLMGVALVVAARGAAAGPPRSCSSAELKAARKEASKVPPKAARARLEALENTCDPDAGSEDKPNQEAYWFWSDLAFATLKDGDPVGCLRILAAPTDLHDATNQAIADTKVGQALAYNWDLCTKAHEAALRDFTSKPCAAAGDQAASATDGGCLMISDGAGFDEFKKALDEDKQDDAARLCPHVVFKAKGKETPLPASGGSLMDTSNCCGYDEVSVAHRAGKRLVRLQSTRPARDCFGGTATTILDTIYEWQGNRLQPVEDDSVGIH